MRHAWIVLISLLFINSSVTNKGASATNDSSYGTYTWSYASNALVSDNTYASVTLDDGEESQYLKISNFGFSIPGGSTIDGIRVKIEGKSATGGFGLLNSMRLYINNVLSGDDYTLIDQYIPNDAIEQVMNYGNATYLWGLSPTTSDINNAGFGVAISYYGTDLPDTYYIDAVTITINYTTASGVKRRVTH